MVSIQERDRIIVCAAEEVSNYRQAGITHIISIANPGNTIIQPEWFLGTSLQLYFGDVISLDDAKQCKTLPPTPEIVQSAVEFARRVFSESKTKLLVHCDYGASRSPALAYVVLADLLGRGLENESFAMIISSRPEAVPNSFIVKIGDKLLNREGALIQPLLVFNQQLVDLLCIS